MNAPLVLISHTLCPYVQRVAIVLHEKNLPFERRDIDLAHKPDWFLKLSPSGKTPMMQVGDKTIFESSVICEYLDEACEPRLHPADPLERAHHRAWMEFASTVLAAVGALYSAPTTPNLAEKARSLRQLLERVDDQLEDGPYFAGASFSMVDAAFAPALRYFEVIDADGHFGFFDGLPKLSVWRERLAMRRSVRQAVVPDYADRLRAFLLGRGTALSSMLGSGSTSLESSPS